MDYQETRLLVGDLISKLQDDVNRDSAEFLGFCTRQEERKAVVLEYKNHEVARQQY